MKLLLPKTKPRASLRPEPSSQGQWQNSKFDEYTGQVYTETTAPIQCSDDRNWTQKRHHLRTVKSVSKIVDIQRGTCTLQDFAIRCLVRNISDLTAEIFKSLPLQLRRRVWDALNESAKMSFDTWKVFSEALRHDVLDPGLFSFSCTIKEPKSPLDIFTCPLTSSSFQFLASLSLSAGFPIPDLIRLSDVSNIAVLEVINTSRSAGAFCDGDRLVRAWHLAALNNGSFSVLRFLRLWNFQNVTGRSLEFLSAFPALAVYDVGGCNFDIEPQLSHLEWTQVYGDNDLRTLKDACLKCNQYTLQSGSEESKSQQPTSHQSNGHSKMRFRPRKLVRPVLDPMLAASLVQKNLSSKNGVIATWEEMTYEFCPVVGELRNDADLAQAGFDIGDQVVVGNTLVNSIPVASLRLGRRQSFSFLDLRMTFIRTDLLYPFGMNAREDAHNNVEEKGSQSTHRETNKRERQGQGVTQSKKRKLDDLLGSLL